MTQTVNQPSRKPTRKVTAMAITTPLAIVLADVLVTTVPFLRDVQSDQLGFLLEVVLASIIPVFAGYMTKERALGGKV